MLTQALRCLPSSWRWLLSSAVPGGGGFVGHHGLASRMILAGIRPGDEVIVPSYTFIATANALLYVGAKPIFADIDPQTFNLDPSALKPLLTPARGGVGCRPIWFSLRSRGHRQVLRRAWAFAHRRCGLRVGRGGSREKTRQLRKAGGVFFSPA